LLIEAFSRIARDRPRARLAILGGVSFEAAYPEQLEQQVKALDLVSRVTFAGNVQSAEVARWLHAADLFALATEREGCCNAVLEALACGVPVVTTPAGDNAHFVRQGVNGLLFPIDDVGALEAALRQALSTSWDFDDISRRLLAQVGSWDHVAEKTLAFMRERREVSGAVPVST
jgi:teichuronic acid biosynthesis glycosyltransferase TuaC